MQESDSPSQLTRERAEKLKEILHFMEHVTSTTLNKEIKFDLLDDFNQFLTKFGTDELTMSNHLMKSPCSTQFSELQKNTRSRFINTISRFLFETEKNCQVIQDLQAFIDKGQSMKSLLVAKFYNAYHDLGNDLNKELLATITESQLEIALQVSKDITNSISSFNFTKFEQPDLLDMFNPVMRKLSKALDTPSLQKKYQSPKQQQLEGNESDKEQIEVDQSQNVTPIPCILRDLPEPIQIRAPQIIRGEGAELWNHLINNLITSENKGRESEMKKLENQQRRDVLVKTLCLTNLMMKEFRQDYNKLLRDIETITDQKFSLKFILASKKVRTCLDQIQEQIQKLQVKPKARIMKFKLPQLKSYKKKQVEKLKKVIGKTEKINYRVISDQKYLLSSFGRAIEEKRQTTQLPCIFQSQKEQGQPFREVQNVIEESTRQRIGLNKRDHKRQQKQRSEKKRIQKEASRQPVLQNS